jgi:hypothetical protein
LLRLSKSIQTKEACPPIITAASPVTSDPNVHSSRLRSRRFRKSYQQELHQALYLNDISSSTTSAATTKVCSCQLEWQTKEEQIKALQEKAAEAQWQLWL